MFYHSQSDKAVVGEVEIVKSAYPDPTAKEGDWVCVDIRPLETWAAPVGLSAMRSVVALADCSLVRQGRLSVMPMTNEHWKAVQKLRKDAEKEVSLR
jgi:predicted RNA-binding protein with PUA-like domain